MHLRSDSFAPWYRIPERFAFGRHDPEQHFAFAGNVNPHLAWSGVPEETASLVVLVVDHDVPSRGDDVNQTGRTVPIDLERVPFFHWVLIDLPPDLREIPEGSHANGIVPRGKAPGPSVHGGLQGQNDYTGWFSGHPDMEGIYAGYDGPAPPWNDERIHGYRFQVHALSVPTLGLHGAFTGSDVRRAMAPHVLASAELVGLYAINPQA
jgi:hypothetical protein